MAERAIDINENCEIVGTAVDSNGVERAYVYDPALNVFLVLPRVGAGNQGLAINDHGTVLASESPTGILVGMSVTQILSQIADKHAQSISGKEGGQHPLVANTKIGCRLNEQASRY